MTVVDKIKKLIDKKEGFGVSITTIAKYCGYHPKSLRYYFKEGITPNQDVEEDYKRGLIKFAQDIVRLVESR